MASPSQLVEQPPAIPPDELSVAMDATKHWKEPHLLYALSEMFVAATVFAVVFGLVAIPYCTVATVAARAREAGDLVSGAGRREPHRVRTVVRWGAFVAIAGLIFTELRWIIFGGAGGTAFASLIALVVVRCERREGRRK